MSKIRHKNQNISKVQNARKLSPGHFEVLEGTTKWKEKSLVSDLYLEIFMFVVFQQFDAKKTKK